MKIDLIIAIISSSVLASFITAMFTKTSKDKSDKHQYITNERKHWRDDLRDATLSLRKLFEQKKIGIDKDIKNIKELKFQTYIEAKVYFQVRFNPYDEEDNKILDKFDNLNEENLKAIEDGVARLLKHDWERVKNETTSNKYLLFIKILLILFVIYYLYPIKEWFGMAKDANTNLFSMNALILEFFAAKTLLIAILLPVALKLLSGFKLLFLKKITIIPKFTSTVSSICNWLNIPYRETIEPKEAKNGKNN